MSRIDVREPGVVDATVGLAERRRALAAASRDGLGDARTDGRVARIDARSARSSADGRCRRSRAAAVVAGNERLGRDAATRGRPIAAARCGVRARRRVRLPLHRSDFGAADARLSLWISSTTASSPTGHVGGPAGAALVPDLAQARSATGRRRAHATCSGFASGVRFSNGAPVRASDVAPRSGRLFAVMHLDIRARPALHAQHRRRSCAPGRRCDLARQSSPTTRAGTVTFHLDTPDPDFLYKLTLPFAFVVPADSPRGWRRGRSPARARIASSRGGPVPAPRRGRLVLVRNPRFRVFAADARRPASRPDRRHRRRPRRRRSSRAVERGAADVAHHGAASCPAGRSSASQPRHASQLHADSLGADRVPLPEHDAFRRSTRRPHAARSTRRSTATGSSTLLGGPVAARPTCQILPPDFPGYQPYCPYGSSPSPAGRSSAPDLNGARRLVGRSGTRGQRVLVWAPANHAAVARYFSGCSAGSATAHVAHRRPQGSDRYYAAIGIPSTRAQIGWAGWARTTPPPPTSSARSSAAAASCQSILRDVELLAVLRPASRGGDRNGRTHPATRSGRRKHAWAAVDRTIVDRAAAVPYANDLTHAPFTASGQLPVQPAVGGPARPALGPLKPRTRRTVGLAAPPSS